MWLSGQCIVQIPVVIDNIVFDPFVSPYASAPMGNEAEGIDKITGNFPADQTEAGSLRQAVEKLERAMMHQALTTCRYNQRKAAEYLGLTYDQFRGKIRKYGTAVLEQASGQG